MKKVIIDMTQTCRLTRQVEVDEKEYAAMLASSENGDIFPDEDQCPEVNSVYEDVDFGGRDYKIEVADADHPDTPVAKWGTYAGYTVQMPVCPGQKLYGMVYGELEEATVTGITYQAFDDDIQHELDQEIHLFFRERSAGCKMEPVIYFGDVGRLWFYTAEEAMAHPVCAEPWRYLQM